MRKLQDAFIDSDTENRNERHNKKQTNNPWFSVFKRLILVLKNTCDVKAFQTLYFIRDNLE